MRILVAGIGNIFFGDDAFGVEVVRGLMQFSWPEDVRVEDFGIRSYDLAYALMEGYDVVILIDATARGDAPGTVSLIEPDLTGLAESEDEIVNAHGMDPIYVLKMARAQGGLSVLGQIYLVGCEPAVLETDELGLSEKVQAAVPRAIELVHSLVRALRSGTGQAFIKGAIGIEGH